MKMKKNMGDIDLESNRCKEIISVNNFYQDNEFNIVFVEKARNIEEFNYTWKMKMLYDEPKELIKSHDRTLINRYERINHYLIRKVEFDEIKNILINYFNKRGYINNVNFLKFSDDFSNSKTHQIDGDKWKFIFDENDKNFKLYNKDILIWNSNDNEIKVSIFYYMTQIIRKSRYWLTKNNEKIRICDDDLYNENIIVQNLDNIYHFYNVERLGDRLPIISFYELSRVLSEHEIEEKLNNLRKKAGFNNGAITKSGNVIKNISFNYDKKHDIFYVDNNIEILTNHKRDQLLRHKYGIKGFLDFLIFDDLISTSINEMLNDKRIFDLDISIYNNKNGEFIKLDKYINIEFTTFDLSKEVYLFLKKTYKNTDYKNNLFYVNIFNKKTYKQDIKIFKIKNNLLNL